MGSYASNADLIARYQSSFDASWATDSEDTGTPDQAVCTEVMGNADGTADSYIAVQYRTPVAVAGDAILAARMKSLVLDMAMWYLALRQGFASDLLQKAYEEAIKWLEGVAAGKIELPAAEAQASTAANTPAATWGAGGESSPGALRKFSRDTQGRI